MTACVFSVLFASMLVRGAVTGEYGPVEAVSPVATLAVTYLLGREALAAWRRSDPASTPDSD